MDKFDIAGIFRTVKGIDGKGFRDFVNLNNCILDCKYCINKKYLKESSHIFLTPEELLEKISIDFKYYDLFGGGVTFGGGESLLQSNQILEFRKLLNKKYNIYIETSININQDIFENFLINMYNTNYLIDFKELNNEIYEKYTNISNNNVIDNIRIIQKYNLQNLCKIRVPLIPNYNTNEDRKKTVEFLKSLGFKDIDCFKYREIKY